MPVVKAVLFDLDDTLFDHGASARAALDAVRQSHACFHAVSFGELAATHARLLEELHEDVMVGRVAIDDARRERFKRLFASVGLQADDDLAARTASGYRARYLSARKAVDGASTLLALVRARALVGVVSNNLLEEQQDKLRFCGLAPFVDTLVVSEAAGVAKPDPAIFAIALERLRCTPAEAVMLGDSWPADIEGARAAGIRPIWFNRDGAAAPDPDVPVLRSLEPAAALEVLLDKLS